MLTGTFLKIIIKIKTNRGWGMIKEDQFREIVLSFRVISNSGRNLMLLLANIFLTMIRTNQRQLKAISEKINSTSCHNGNAQDLLDRSLDMAKFNKSSQ